MKERFLKLPAVLKKQILIRLGLGTGAFLMFFIILMCSANIQFSLPCLIISVILLINGLTLLRDCINGNYIRIDGICSGTVKSRLYKRFKEISITTNGKLLTIPIHKKIRNIKEGVAVSLYLSPNTTVYERSDGYVLYSYYAIENIICK